ncbi:GyrI-like domain-containing protein [Candidatus Saccharibacteria bacterium]|nr:GyrI-like domain-containing protein [Candidatus Saccharibacteria bacterium]
MSDVIDYVKENKQLYKPGKKPEIIDVPKMQFIMVDGKGAPDPDEGSSKDVTEFQEAFQVLYGLAYSIKMSYRGDEQLPGYQNFKVPPPEALWWMTDNSDFDVNQPDKWRWTLMLRMPDFVTDKIVTNFIDKLVIKKKSDIYKKARLEDFKEGKSVQIMHVGPYSAEGPNIEAIHKYALEQGYKLHGKHHEIYYGDPRRSAPEKLKTVLRQPVKK